LIAEPTMQWYIVCNRNRAIANNNGTSKLTKLNALTLIALKSGMLEKIDYKYIISKTAKIISFFK
jgi:hypothetical protein